MKLNREEIGLGLAFGGSMMIFVGIVPGLVLGLVCGLLWAIGGSGLGRAWRFVGVPVAGWIALGLGGYHIVPCLIGSVHASVVLSLGYGIPSDQPKDDGSPIGRFFYYGLAKMREDVATLWTRGTLAGLLGAGYVGVHGVSLAWMAFIGLLVALHLVIVHFVEGNIEF